IPTVLLIVIGVQNKYGINDHLYGFIAAFATFIYCIMEEYGWRGYLQTELQFLRPIIKFILVGFIWYAWHLIFLMDTTLMDNVFFLGTLILGSWGIGKIAELTHSILACACFHLIVNIFMYNSFFDKAFSGTSKLIILIVSISLWVLILVKWNKVKKNNELYQD
ncbi:CPBP family intramembrane glutamic endopeptidase, partial [Runella sp.]|uniref:CPBP family intramembrane glutamic endopeptidase n=1 Tax=Runella sp. TaxID=1960881 RepID=UPI0030160334